MIVEEQSIFVFIFPSPEDRQEGTENLTVEGIELIDVFGDPVTTEPLSLAEGSNVLVILVGGDEDLAEAIEIAISESP